MIVVVFDGICTLCNSSVDFLIRHDLRGQMRFVSFQDERLATLLPHVTLPETIDTILVAADGRLYDRSNAILRLAAALPLPWSLVLLFRMIPRPIRDALYRLVARNRYRWFGTKSSCRVPLPHERNRFL
jgi:predicted DCC family thiol-disulfide oxidoreductase YuxK